MKKIIFLLFVFVSVSILAQEKFSKSISFVNDNDLYTSFYRDRYYTNGMFLNFNYLANTNNDKLEKKIFQFEFGHEMYTPFKAIVEDPNLHDRPFAGHLFGKFGILRAYKSNKIFRTALQLGIVGPDAKGAEIQELIHEIYGFRDINGWDFQIQNTLSLNAELDYMKTIHTDKTKTVDFTWINKARIGTIYTDITSALQMRIGINPLASLINSIGFNTNLNNDTTNYSREIETYFFFQPSLRLAIYDATMQGSLFNDNSPVTTDILPVIFNFNAGMKFSANRWNFGYTVIYHTRKMSDAVHQFGNVYGTISVEYLLR